MGKKDAAPEDATTENEGSYDPKAYRVYSPYLFIGTRRSTDEDLGSPLSVGNRFQWIFANMNFTLGLGPLWRFPIVAYTQHGGPYVVAYVVVFLLVGYPLAFLEIALGQSTRRRASKVFQLCAALEGLPVTMAVWSLVISVLYSVLFSYSLFYFYHSFSGIPVWDDCKSMNVTAYRHVCKNTKTGDGCSDCTYVTPHELFWNFKVLGGLKQVGEHTALDGLNLPLLACLLMSWLITSVFVFEKIRKHSLKFEIWFAPIFLASVTILLILSVYVLKTTGSDAASNGVAEFFVPDLQIFRNLHIWREATQQVFFSLGIGTGPLITLGSLCRFKSPVHVDSAIVCAISLFYTFVGGILFFLAIGFTRSTVGGESFLAEEINLYGSGLFFIAYSNMFSRLPAPPFWSAAFFLFVVAVGTRAVLSSLDTTVSVIRALLPKNTERRCKSHVVTYGVIVVGFVSALFCITKRDTLVFYTLYVYPGATILPVVVLAESVAVAWIYGVARFSGDVEYMLGFKPNCFFRLVWLLTPVYLIMMIAASWSYEWFFETDEPLLPAEFKIAGWLLVAIAFLPVPVKFVVNCVEFKKRKRLKEIFNSRDDFGPDELELWYRSDLFGRERKSDASEVDKNVTDPGPRTHETVENSRERALPEESRSRTIYL